MIESGNFNPEYKLLSFREKNLELRKIVSAFPRFSFFEEMDAIGSESEARGVNTVQVMLERREEARNRHDNSELKAPLFKRIDALLTEAPITSVFKEHLKFMLSIYFNGGISQRRLEEDAESADIYKNDELRILLGIGIEDSTGIFEAQSARDIERFWYSGEYYGEIEDREYGYKELSFKQRLAAKFRHKFWDITEGPMEAVFKTGIETRTLLLNRWRKEFKKVYGQRLKRLPKEIFEERYKDIDVDDEDDDFDGSMP